MDRIKLGDIAKDTITGFKGVVVAITEWLHGCARITIQPQDMKDGKPLDTGTFDDKQVRVVKTGAFAAMQATGGPQPEPRRHRTPSRH